MSGTEKIEPRTPIEAPLPAGRGGADRRRPGRDRPVRPRPKPEDDEPPPPRGRVDVLA